MMVTFVSECEKKALPKTRRVLDAFANRIGQRTWQTVITNEGLQAVHKLLRKTASKNTAVSCHWIRSRSRSEFLWSVGNKDKFNAEGVVPVNYTNNDMEKYQDKTHWKTLPVMQYAAAIAGLFHDFGKATVLFQKKLDPEQKTPRSEPYRHEWISYCLFHTFVEDKTDEQWLSELCDIQNDAFSGFVKYSNDISRVPKLSALAPLASLVAWLIVTHHKLPIYPNWKETSPPSLEDVDQWLDDSFHPLWNSHNCNDEDQKERVAENWQLERLPVQSKHWCYKASKVASEARSKLQNLLREQNDWLHGQLFTTHLSRLCLILADHYYSSQDKITERWSNSSYEIYANTYTDKNHPKFKEYKQQLDEHLIGVAHHAKKITKKLRRLNASLSQLKPSAELTGNIKATPEEKEKFGWQDKARKLAEKIGNETQEHGFFGINMASTGKGKTRANAIIMATLGLQTGRVRFSVALGLRVLTLQTGNEFRNKLGLTEEELAIAIGGTAVKQLFENQQSKNQQEETEIDQTLEAAGSESLAEFSSREMHVHYKGESKKHSLSHWTKEQKGLDDLLNAPVLVSTIDHLIPATEGTKSGKQIPATLRLLTSDLVLDEPDDFSLSDLPALCRLVNWAGMLGSRVLLSTATIPPSLAYALFQAYQAGWKEYVKANLETRTDEIVCAWFDDECDPQQGKYSQFDNYRKAHEKFVQNRVVALQNLPAKRIADIIEIPCDKDKSIAQCMAKSIQGAAIRLHTHHAIFKQGKSISIGLVRMANINPLIAVTQELIQLKRESKDFCIYYCVYHSRYPLAIRSAIECKLDRLLNRKKEQSIWEESEIKQAIQKQPDTQHHIFIVLASPVAEVGRDHDYDWAIVEPSSMRSIIQLAGRVLRHRDNIPEQTNILLLNKNYKALIGEKICFERPGFESKQLAMAKHGLNEGVIGEEVLEKGQYQQITATERITLPESYRTNNENQYINLVELEHKALATQLFDKSKGANVWWKKQSHWCGEVQRQQRFRDSKKDEAYYLCLNNDYDDPKWQWRNERVFPAEFGDAINIHNFELGDLAVGNHFWLDQDPLLVYKQLVDDFDYDLTEISHLFGAVRLTEYEKSGISEYKFHPQLGVFQDIGENE